MTKEDFKPLTPHESRLMDALLGQAMRPEDVPNQQRIEVLFAEIRKESQATGDDTTAENSTCHTTTVPIERQRSSVRRWFPLSLVAAALVVVAFVIQLNTANSSALAAVDRSIVAEQKNIAREYAVTLVTRSTLGANRTNHHTLFVQQRDFAICATPRIGKGEVWLGGRGTERWIVPRIGPVLVGEEAVFDRSLLSDRVYSTPFLSVATILERMKRGYELSFSGNVGLVEGDSTVICDKVVGTKLRRTRLAFPDQIEIWTDPETGFARRIALRWSEGNKESRWIEATAQLVGTPELPTDFFQHGAHHDMHRTVERLSSE